MSRQRFEAGFLARLPEPPRKVAILRASRVGDFLCATPAYRAALPASHITLITLPMLRDLAERLPYFDRVVDFPGFPGIAEQLFEPGRFAAFLHAMRAERFDLAIQMQGSGVNSNPFLLLLGAHYTAGFVRSGDALDRPGWTGCRAAAARRRPRNPPRTCPDDLPGRTDLRRANRISTRP